jgi:hypothetical protein
MLPLFLTLVQHYMLLLIVLICKCEQLICCHLIINGITLSVKHFLVER